jgi:hypothetical protein
MFLLYKVFEINYMILKKSAIETLDIVSWKDQKWHLHSIQIILIILINSTRRHFIYWHTIIDYNFNNVK